MSSKIGKLLLQRKNNYKKFILHDIKDEDLFLNTVAQNLKNGVEVVEFCGNNLSSFEFFSVAKKLRDLSGVFNAILIIKDRIDIAKLINADGVIIDNNSIPIKYTQQLIENGLLLGYNAEDNKSAQEAEEQGVDFLVSNMALDTKIKCFADN